MNPIQTGLSDRVSQQGGEGAFGAWEWDVRTNALTFCECARALAGLTGQDEIVTFEKLRSATHEQDHGFAVRALENAIDSGRRSRGVIEWRSRRPNGSFRWVLAQVNADFDPNASEPQVVRYFGAILDIDPYKSAASALSEAQIRLSLALDAGKMALFDYEISGDRLLSSPALNDLLGVAREREATIEDLRAGFPPGERDRVRLVAQGSLQRGEPCVDVEFRFHGPNAKLRWLKLKAAFVFDSGGELDRLVGVLSDVSYRQAADETNAYLAAVVSSSADAIVTFDHAGEILTWNEAAERIFGWSKEEAIGKPFNIILAQDPQFSAYDPLEKAWSGDVVQFEGERRRKYGRIFHASITAAPVRAPNGQIVSIVATVRDATSRRNNEKRQALLVRELHHRVRNTLATVQAIAGASARYASSLEEFRDTFSQRISSLAQAHALLTEDNWQSVELRRLMLLELKPYADLDCIALNGPDTILDAQAAIPVGMAIHELTTNAAKHGALSTTSGRVEISWSVFGAGDAREIELLWREHGGPNVTPPSRRGFGSLLLNTIMKMQLGAEVESDYSPEGLQFRLRARLPEPTR